MRYAEKEKKNLLPNSVPTGPGLENSKKKKEKNSRNYKTSFRHYFYPIREEIGREREEKFYSQIPFQPDPS